MIELKRHGSYLKTDVNGFVCPINRNIEIQPRWQPIINDVINFYKEHLDGIISIYVRGSVAKGEAIEGISDLDSFCIVKNGSKLLRDMSQIKDEFVKELQSKYSYCTHVEISTTQFLHIGKELPQRKRSVISELIKTQSLCVYGEDLAKDITPFKISDMIGHSLYIEEEIKKLPEYFLDNKEKPDDLKGFCGWIARRVVRSGFDLVMEREQLFTRDLYLCFESFSKYYPDKELQMRDILGLCLNPISDISAVNVYLDQICPWLMIEINDKLK
jgi:predicted nucleotidyltransferase